MTTKTKLVKRQSSVLLPERDIDKSPVLECVGLGVTFGGLKAVEDFDLTIGRTSCGGRSVRCRTRAWADSLCTRGADLKPSI